MKEIIQTSVVYEIGDVLDMTDVKAEYSHSHKAKKFDMVKKAIVLKVIRKKNGAFNYQVLADNFSQYTFTSFEQGEEKYVDHIDLSMLFNE